MGYFIWSLALAACVTLPVLSTPSAGCKKACNDLMTALPQGTVTTMTQDVYWANQIEEIKPACFARPKTPKGVSKVIQIVKARQCPFAVRGGGHSDVPGANNLADGITLDLGAFKDVELADGNTITRFGPGINWGAIYTKLDPMNLTVVGGREEQVGASGLTLGGGISYFSGLYGFACDNVRNYQIVLANGDIVEANSTSKYADLFKALRGGVNNFGVVTRYDLDTYKYNKMQGGMLVNPDSQEIQDQQIAAFQKFVRDNPKDPRAALFISIDYAEGAYFWDDGLYYTEPAPTIPKIFNGFYTSTLNNTRLVDTERTTTHGDLANELGKTQPDGMRQQFHTGTFVADAKLQAQMVGIFKDEINKLLLNALVNASALTANFAFQPIPTNLLQHQSRRGGNVLGIDVSEAPLMLLSFAWPWLNPTSDALFTGAMNRVKDRCVAAAKKMGLFNEFIYTNYASPGERVIAGYGPANQKFLQQVSKKYDPEQVFQKLVPGGFKLYD